MKVSEVKLSYKSRVNLKDAPKITSSLTAHQVLRNNWSEDIEFNEQFYILLLNKANKVLGQYLVSSGGLSGTVVDPKNVFIAALKTRAAAIILAHNHPSGNLKASEADKQVTNRLVKAGELLDIKVLDHIILSPCGDYFSFMDEGLIN